MLAFPSGTSSCVASWHVVCEMMQASAGHVFGDCCAAGNLVVMRLPGYMATTAVVELEVHDWHPIAYSLHPHVLYRVCPHCLSSSTGTMS